jgi:hypothetical protein
MNKNNKKQIKEATGHRGSGQVRVPLSPGVRLFNKEQLQPFVVPTSKYDSAELSFDSYDGEMSTPKSKISKIEKESRKISKYVKKHPEQNDEDGGVLNQTPGKGKNIVPITREWIEITKDTIIEDVTSKGLKTTLKKESLRDLIKKVLKEEFKKPLN